METILKVKLDKKSHASWIVTTIKNIIRKPFKDLGLPVLYFKWTQEASCQNSIILAAFNGILGVAIEAQKVNPLDYSS